MLLVWLKVVGTDARPGLEIRTQCHLARTQQGGGGAVWAGPAGWRFCTQIPTQQGKTTVVTEFWLH